MFCVTGCLEGEDMGTRAHKKRTERRKARRDPTGAQVIAPGGSFFFLFATLPIEVVSRCCITQPFPRLPWPLKGMHRAVYGRRPLVPLLRCTTFQVYVCVREIERVCVYRGWSWFGRGEVVLTHPLVHSADTSCALRGVCVCVCVAHIPPSCPATRRL